MFQSCFSVERFFRTSSLYSLFVPSQQRFPIEWALENIEMKVARIGIVREHSQEAAPFFVVVVVVVARIVVHVRPQTLPISVTLSRFLGHTNLLRRFVVSDAWRVDLSTFIVLSWNQNTFKFWLSHSRLHNFRCKWSVILLHTHTSATARANICWCANLHASARARTHTCAARPELQTRSSLVQRGLIKTSFYTKSTTIIITIHGISLRKDLVPESGQGCCSKFSS